MASFSVKFLSLFSVIVLKKYEMMEELFQFCTAILAYRAGARAVDLGGPSIYQGCQSLKLSTKAAFFKRLGLLIGGCQACRMGS